MIVRWVIGFLFLSFWSWSSGQNPDFLVQEERHESYAGKPGESKLTYRSQNLYRYNSSDLLDRLIKIRCWVNEEFQCQKQEEGYYTYDQKGRIATFQKFIYNHSSGELETIIDYHYLYHNELDYLEFIEVEYDVSIDGDSFKESIQYNKDGKWLSSISKRTDENGRTYTVESTYLYNEKGCELSSEITGSGNIPGTEAYYYVRSDYTYFGDCQQKTAHHYEYRSDLNITALRFQEKWEYEWDSKGNAVKITEYRNQADWDTVLFFYQQSQIHYDAQDRDTLRTTIVGDSIKGTRYRTQYNEYDHLMLRQIEVWDTAHQQWILDYDHHLTYNEFGNLIHSLKYTDYNIKSGQFLGYSEYSVEYNTAQQEVYTNSKSISGEPGHFFEDEVETFLDYGCDGRFLRSESVSLLHGNSNVSTNTYFDIPHCSVLPADDFDFNLIPNPTSDLVHLQFDQVIQDGLIRVYNTNGVLLISKKVGVGSFFYLDLIDLPSGIYFVLLESNRKQIYHKMVKI